MKKIIFTSALLITHSFSTCANADGSYENPALPAYLAEKAELPAPAKLEFPFPEGFYVSGTIAAGKPNSIKINTRSGVYLPTQRENKTLTLGGASIGYLFREAGWFNQVDIQYMRWSSFDTTSEGHFNLETTNLRKNAIRSQIVPGSINSSVATQTGMAKLYSTLNIGHSLFPYVFAGIGVYHNNAPGQVYVNNLVFNSRNQPNDLIRGRANNERNAKNSKNGAAGAVGLGVRLRVSRYVMLDLNYQYDYLGKLPDWNFTHIYKPYPNSINPRSYKRVNNIVEGANLRGQMVALSLMFQPWGFASEGD